MDEFDRSEEILRRLIELSVTVGLSNTELSDLMAIVLTLQEADRLAKGLALCHYHIKSSAAARLFPDTREMTARDCHADSN